MTLHAKDMMVTDFDTIHIEAPVEEAIRKISNGKIRETGHRTASLLVVDDLQKLSGVVTMSDILYHLRPDFLNFGIDSHEIDWEGQLETLINTFEGKQVQHIMTPNVVGVDPDDHIMVLLDMMVKNKYRRLPVLVDQQPIGVVYLPDIFHRLFSQKKI